MAAAFLVASLSTSRLLRRFGAKVLAAGATLQGVGLIILGVTVVPGLADVCPGLAGAWHGGGRHSARAWS